MKRFLNYIISLSAAVLFFSCSDDFVNERLEISGVAASFVIISPDWEAGEYQFKCEGAGNSGYVIESKPEWLIAEDLSGRFFDDVAIIHCKASAKAEYSKTGVYIDQMIITSGEKKYAVPVYYITEGNPSVQVARTFEINYNNYSNQLQISNSGEGILLWDIAAMPDWLRVDMDQFNMMSVMLGKGTTASVPFILDAEKAASASSLNGKLTLVTNDKNNALVDIAVSANLGTPGLNIYVNDLPVEFGSTSTSKTLPVYNNGNGILVWKLEGMPGWLNVSHSGGIINGYHGIEVTFTCDRSKLSPGLNSATVILSSNDPAKPSYPIVVTARAPGSNADVYELEGNIVDAAFNKSTNTLYYITSQPNKLVAYDVMAKAVSGETALSKAPTCLAISDDFTKAAVGHGGMISAVDLNNHTVVRTFEYGYSIYDMEWTEGDWFCYTKAGTYMNNLLWINVSTAETGESDDRQMDEGTYLKKVPAQPYVIAARRYSSPSGITVFDTDTKLQKNYRHQSIGNYWFSADGQYMYESSGSVYKVNAIVDASGRNPENIAPIGKLNYPFTSYYAIPWLDHCKATRSIFGLSMKEYQKVSTTIYQFEDNDYTMVKTYAYDDYYQPVNQAAAYEVEARYVFSNGTGSELSVLRKGKNNNNWSVEFITVEQ